jgi:hypothetical protein
MRENVAVAMTPTRKAIEYIGELCSVSSLVLFPLSRRLVLFLGDPQYATLKFLFV